MFLSTSSQLTPSRARARARTRNTPKSRRYRHGLSLLEVVLALSILAVTAGLLSQITRQATNNALMTQRVASAQILCAATMSEVLAGAIPMQPTGWTPITGSFARGSWSYKLETVAAERPNMVGLRLAVTDLPDEPGNPELFYLVRWVIDPSLGLDTPPQTDASGTGGTKTTGSSGSASSAGGIQ
jgi:general secretion pathway protein I